MIAAASARTQPSRAPQASPPSRATWKPSFRAGNASQSGSWNSSTIASLEDLERVGSDLLGQLGRTLGYPIQDINEPGPQARAVES